MITVEPSSKVNLEQVIDFATKRLKINISEFDVTIPDDYSVIKR